MNDKQVEHRWKYSPGEWPYCGVCGCTIIGQVASRSCPGGPVEPSERDLERLHDRNILCQELERLQSELVELRSGRCPGHDQDWGSVTTTSAGELVHHMTAGCKVIGFTFGVVKDGLEKSMQYIAATRTALEGVSEDFGVLVKVHGTPEHNQTLESLRVFIERLKALEGT